MKAAIFLVLLVVIYCNIEATEGQKCSPPGVCGSVFDPVCARRGNQRKTFSNRCLLNGQGCREGWVFFKRGKC